MRANHEKSPIGRAASLTRMPLALAVGVAMLSFAPAADAAPRFGSSMGGGGFGGFGGRFSTATGPRGPSLIVNPGIRPLGIRTPGKGPGGKTGGGGNTGGGGGSTAGGSDYPGGKGPPRPPRGPKWPKIPIIVATPPVVGIAATPTVTDAKPAKLSKTTPQGGGSGGGGSGSSGTSSAPRSSSGMPPAGERRYVPDEVLIQLASNVSPRIIDALAQRHRLNRVESLTLTSGITIYRWKIQDPNQRSVPTVIRALESDRVVMMVSPNYLFDTQQQQQPEGEAQAGGPSSDLEQYALAKLRLPQAHALAKGDKVLIAVIDSSIDTAHPELAGMVVNSYDALGTAEKPHSHGTAIAGAIVANAKLMGVAPRARILGVTAFGATANSAEGTTFAILKGIDWALAQGARVINMSFAGPRDPALERKIAEARKQGVIMVAAAGNAGPKSPALYPAADRNVIAVTATDAEDKLFQAANRGSHIAVAAPGVDILLPAPDAGYQFTSGTSFAAAEVSGIIALMVERKPDIGQDAVRKALTATAQDLGPKGVDTQFGAGLVDAYRAVVSLAPVVGETAGRGTPAAARQ
jgi:Subtilase family